MTTWEAHYVDTKLRVWGRRMKERLTRFAIATAHETSKVAPVAKAHVTDHGYSIVGLALVDAAMFTHSVFTGLLVTGLSFLAFEWKVASE